MEFLELIHTRSRIHYRKIQMMLCSFTCKTFRRVQNREEPSGQPQKLHGFARFRAFKCEAKIAILGCTFKTFLGHDLAKN